MKTTTLPKPETQARIQQVKLGVDWHSDHFRVARMCDGQSPQPAQRFTPAPFLTFVQKQLTLADQVLVVYEAGSNGHNRHPAHFSFNVLINARSETLQSRTAFREAFKQRCCLIPADSFFELKEMHGQRQPFRV